MKLTCLSKGGGFYFPPCHILDMCGFRILLECPLDLSGLTVFNPITSEAPAFGGLIQATPLYKTVSGLQDWDVGLIDVVLVSSPMGMLGLPFLTRNRRFTAKVYATEAAARFGRLMMHDLVSVHAEAVQFYGPHEETCSAEWMKQELDKLPESLQKFVTGEEGDVLQSWMPLYSATDIDECLKKIRGLKYAEECCYNGALILKPLSSGLEIGACNWTICGPKRSVAYISSSTLRSLHATSFDYHSLIGTEHVIFSDFSSFHEIASLNHESIQYQSKSEPMETSVNLDDEEEESLTSTSEASDELEKANFICSCIVDTAKGGGSVLIPVDRLGITLLLLETVSKALELLELEVPIYIICTVAEETLAFVNSMPEWLSREHQLKLFSGEPLFSHEKLIKEKKLHIHSILHSSALLNTWKEPCIVFSPYWSLRLGPAVQLLNHWHKNKNCLLIVEQGIEAEYILSPFKPVELKVLQCTFLSGLLKEKIPLLLKFIQPRVVLIPEFLRALIPSIGIPSLILYYQENVTLPVPRLKEDFEACLSTDLAFQLQPKKLPQVNVAIARLKGRLCLSSGKFMLLPSNEQNPAIKMTNKKLRWGSVDPDRLLLALQEKGVNASLHKEDATAASSSSHHILVDECEAVTIYPDSCQTLIAAGDWSLATKLYEAVSRVAADSEV